MRRRVEMAKSTSLPSERVRGNPFKRMKLLRSRNLPPCRRDGRNSENDPRESPLALEDGTHILVEADRVVVPVENQPVAAGAATFLREGQNVLEKRLPGAPVPGIGMDVDVLEIECGFSCEGRVGLEEEGVGEKVAVLVLDDKGFRRRFLAEKSLAEGTGIGLDLMGQVLEGGEFEDKAVDGFAILGAGGAEFRHGREG